MSTAHATVDAVELDNQFTPASLLLALAELNGIGRLAARGLLKDPLGYFAPPKKQEIVIPKGTKKVVLFTPGFMSPGTSMQWLADYVRSDTVHTLTWGPHANIPFHWVVNHFFELVKELSEKSGIKIDVVGHSLGGTIACHGAHEFPDYVGDVYTLGSPLEALYGATNLEAAAKLVFNRYLQMVLHKGIFDSWAPESTKGATSGNRTAFVAANDAIVAVFATMLAESDTTTNLIFKSCHVGLPTDKYLAKTLKLMVHEGTNRVDLPDDVRKRLLTRDELEALQDQPVSRRIVEYYAHTPSRFTSIARAALATEKTVSHLICNVPDSVSGFLHLPGSKELIDATTKLIDELVVGPKGVGSNVANLAERRKNGHSGSERDAETCDIAPVVPFVSDSNKVPQERLAVAHESIHREPKTMRVK